MTPEPRYRCPVCKKTKPLSQWYTRRGGKRGSSCKLCHHEDARQRRLKTLFSLTVEDYDTILAHQGGVCAMCRKPPKKLRLAVDHDHKTGLVRGLLCWHCNSALGKFNDDLEQMERGVDYLRNPPAVLALGEERLGRKGRTSNRVKKPKRKKSSSS